MVICVNLLWKMSIYCDRSSIMFNSSIENIPGKLSNLSELLCHRAERQPDKTAYIFLKDGETEEIRLTYQELDRQARSIAVRLKSVSSANGRALLVFPPGLEYITAFFGCLYAGVIAVPVYPPHPARLERTLPRLMAIVKDARPCVVLTLSSLLPVIQPVFSKHPNFENMNWVTTDNIPENIASDWQGASVTSGDSLAFLQYTSGSTGNPKGVMVTHGNLLHNSALIHECFGNSKDAHGVIWLPPYHDMGLIGGILQPLYGGFPVTLMSPIAFLQKPVRWLQAISRYKATTSGGPNFAYDLCARRITPEQRAGLDLSSWEVAFNGAEPVREKTLDRFSAAFEPCGFRRSAFYPCYGLAEATLIVSGGIRKELPVPGRFQGDALEQNDVIPAKKEDHAAHTIIGCGKTLNDQRIVIVNPDTLELCHSDRVGEIWVSGKSVAQGYWQHPGKTKEIFQAYIKDTTRLSSPKSTRLSSPKSTRLSSPKSGEGPFLRTGDLGFLKDGTLFVTGRLKDLIIIRGRNHYPEDIEQTVEQSCPGVRPGCSAVFRVEVEDEERVIVAAEIERRYGERRRKSGRAGHRETERRGQSDRRKERVLPEFKPDVPLSSGMSLSNSPGHNAATDAIRKAVAEQHELEVYGVLLLKPGSIPKTSSGKIQRHACRAGFLNGSLNIVESSVLEAADVSESEVSLSREKLLAAPPEERQILVISYLQNLASRVLKADLSRTDPQLPLTRLGIDSLKAIELEHRLESDLGVVMPMVRFLEGASIIQLVTETFEQLEPDKHPAPNTKHQTSNIKHQTSNIQHQTSNINLSYNQQSLWFLYKLAPESAAYNLPFAVYIRSDVDIPALRRAFQTLISRHPSLRTTYTVRNDKPVQQVHDDQEVHFEETDASAWSTDELIAQMTEESYRPFDLENGPILRLNLYTRSPKNHVLLLNIHHIATDLWSFSILMDELRVLYPRFQEKTEVSPLQKKTSEVLETSEVSPLTYPDYVRWQTEMLAGPEGERLRTYWQKQLGGYLPVLNLPGDHLRPPVQTYNGASHPFRLNEDLTRRIEDLAQTSGATLYMTLLAAFQALLHRYTGQEDILVGSPATVRTRAEFRELTGYVVNTIVMRSDLSEDPSFSVFLGRVRQTVLDALKHRDYPLQLLIEQLQPDREPGRSPLFQVMFALQEPHRFEALAPFVTREAGARINIGGLELEPFPLEQRMAQFDMTLVMVMVEGCLSASLEYNTDLFDTAFIRRMAGHFQTLLEGIAADPDQLVSELPILTQAEQHQLLVEFNDTAADYPRDKTIVDMFEEQVEKTPDNVAVIFEDTQLSYRELNEQTNRVAHFLRDKYLMQPDDRVGVMVDRSERLVISLLGIMKSGGAYMPVDPTYPAERISYILRDSGCKVVLTEEQHGSLLSLMENNPEIVNLRDIRHSGTENPCPAISPHDLAYIIYTSGSTGQPKGVMLEHSGFVNMILSQISQLGIRQKDRVLQFASCSFDGSMYEIFAALFSGAGLVCITDDQVRDPEKLVRAIQRKKVSVAALPPSYLEILGLERLRGLKALITAGENAIPDEGKFTDADHQYWNLYGPTEASVTATCFPVKPHQSLKTDIPIGKPVSNTEVLIMDASGKQLQPIGIPGEMCLGGVGLARGYLNKPELTAEKFVSHPFREGERLYRTGDLGCWLPDGNIEFLGRNDDQVKIRGHRIELGEIEDRLVSHEAVKKAVVVAKKFRGSHEELTAYITGQNDLNMSELRDYLKVALPDYMIPSYFVRMEKLPLTPNKKIDKKALPDPSEAGMEMAEEYMPPLCETESRLADIWQEVLGVDKVGVRDNFFDLGGHSLLIIRVQKKLQEIFNIDIPVVNLFRYPTIAALAHHLAQEHDVAQPAQKIRTRKQKYDSSESVAIISMAGRFPEAVSVDEFWQNLCDGKESVSFFTDEELAASGANPALLNNPNYVKAKGVLSDIELFDTFFFGFNPREAEITDVQHRIFLESAWEAIESAGYDPENYDGSIGVYAGSGMNTYFLNNLYPGLDSKGTASTYQTMIASDKDFLSSLTSYKLNLKGPSIAVQTACSTSLVAVHLACQGLLVGDCDMALAGGVSVDVPQKNGYLHEEGMILSPDGLCRAFDAGAQGTVSGNGCGVVLLKRLSDALADGDSVQAVIRGSAINNDGSSKVGYTAPGVDGQADVIADAQAVAGVDPESVTYVETHGTGTILGDPIEIEALTQAFRRSHDARRNPWKKAFCAIGSVKTNVGHLNAAAGVTSLIKTVLAIRHKMIPPSLHFEQPNPEIDFANSPFYVNTTLSQWEADGTPRRAGVSSFGIGGTNAHVVLEDVPSEDNAQSTEDEIPRPYQLLVLSAKTGSALDTMTANLADFMNQHPDLDPADVAYTLQAGRKAFNHRRMLVCQGMDDAATALSPLDPKRVFTDSREPGTRPVAFMFSGQGAQYVNMGLELYQVEPSFQEQVDLCSEILIPHLEFDLRHILYPSQLQQTTDNGQLTINHTAIAQPALFVFEYALARLWMEWRVRPKAMIGHSIGEYVAACLAGVFSLEDALSLVAARGQMMQQVSGGAMLAVLLPEKDVQSMLDNNLSLAAVNGPSLCVVSGPTESIEVLQEQLTRQDIGCRRLHTSHAFHSEMMCPITEPFTERVRQVSLKPPQIPYISNVTGTWITPAEATDPNYWVRHLRQTVRFAQGVQELLNEPEQILLEVGPGRTLSTFAMQQREKSNNQVPDTKKQIPIVLTSVRHPKEGESSDAAFLLTTLGKLWLAGVNIAWPGFYAYEKRHRVPLPTYPFERQRCWIEAPVQNPKPASNIEHQTSNIEHPVSKKPDISDWFYIPYWKPSVPPVPLRPGDLAKRKLCWLVFSDECGLGSQLVKQLREEEQDVITVGIGSEFAKLNNHEYMLNPQHHDAYDILLSNIRQSDRIPEMILHLWSVTGNGHKDEDFELTQNSGLYSLLFLTQAIGKQNAADPFQITVISNGIHRMTGEESLCPAKATVLGPVKVIPQEYPNIRCRNIDLYLKNGQRSTDIDLLLAEIIAEPSESVIAFRGNHRWIQSFEPIRLEAPVPGKPSMLKERGVYLITGGFGGMGLVLAEYLAKTVRAKLILTGRSAFPARDKWEEWLTSHDEQDSTSQKIQKLQEMEASGAEVLAFSADVADQEQMREVIAQAEERFGRINGVIHSAGLADYEGVIQKRTKEMTERILAPKVKGTLVLDSLLKDAKPDFLMLCSSLGNILYKEKFGQVGYSAANEFLDAFAYYKTTSENGIFTVSVNWDDWQEVGMSTEAVKRWFERLKLGTRNPNEQRTTNNQLPISGFRFQKELLKDGLLPSEGAEVFNRIIENRLSRIAVSTRDLILLIEQDSLSRPFLETFEKANLPSPSYSRPELSNAYIAPRNETEQTLADIWQKLLGIKKIGIYDNFFELGGHSLMAIQLISYIRDAFQAELSLQNLFDTPTVAKLAENIELLRLAPDQPVLHEEKQISSNTEAAKSAFDPSLFFNENKIRGYPDTPLICMQSHGKKVRPFFVHPADGSIFCYTELVSLLGTDQPFFGLQALGLSPDTSPLTRIEDMAKKYISAIQHHVSEGPYVLGGYSGGGNIAYEMARQLRGQGQEVSLLVLINSFASYTPVKDDTEYFILFSSSLGEFFNTDLLRSYCKIRGISLDGDIEGRVSDDLKQLSYDERLNVLWECIQKAGITRFAAVGIDYLKRALKVYTANLRALFNYTPQSSPDSILLFRAVDDPKVRQMNDAMLGWERYASDSLEVHNISDAHHYTILRQPHVRALAKKLKHRLRDITS